MSYILEAIKKAESERGNSSLYENNYVDKPLQASKETPWVAIAIFVNAAILIAWIGMQVIYDTDNEKISDEESVIESAAPQENEFVPALESRITIEEQAEIVELENKKPTLLNNRPQLNDPGKSLIKSKPSFIGKTVKTESYENKVIDNKKITIIDKKVTTAKVEPLSMTDNLFLEKDNQVANVSLPAIELPTEVQSVREARIVDNPSVPSFNELPYALQQRIPDLVISVHIYNPVKEARKVRVNGKLLRQGDALNNDLLIQEITSYGVVFNYSGELFKMTLR